MKESLVLWSDAAKTCLFYTAVFFVGVILGRAGF
jgi:hypothetical protein